MLVGARTMSDIISELAFIHFAVCPGKLSPSMLDVIYIVSIELISVKRLPFSSSLPFSSQELSFIHATVLPFIDAVSFEFSINKLTNIGISIHQFLDPVAMLQAVLYLSLIVKPISVQDYCVACLLAIPKISHVLIILLINLLSESAGFAFGPFSIIAHKAIWIRFINIDDFDCAFSMPHAIFELPQIEVLFRNVFKAEAILISFAWQISFPLAEIKGAVEIPDYVFIGFQLKVNPVFKTTNHQLLFAFLNFHIEQ